MLLSLWSVVGGVVCVVGSVGVVVVVVVPLPLSIGYCQVTDC